MNDRLMQARLRRLHHRLVEAVYQLKEQGEIDDEGVAEYLDVMGRMDEMSAEEFEAKLASIRTVVAS